MVMCMKEIGSMIKQRDMVSILIWMEQNMKGIGKKTNNMAEAKKYGQMEQCMKENMY